MEFYHRPVMLEEVMEGLELKPHGIYFDGTVGGGNHSYEILRREPTARLIATDKDGEAIKAANERLAPFAGRFTIHRTDFKNYAEVFAEENISEIDGFLIDLGISSWQIDSEERGFAYTKPNAPLDMRMDTSKSFSAKDIVNGYGEAELARILREYGEERYAGPIARSIIKARAQGEIKTCGELRELVEGCYPARYRTPACAKQVFQAIRIEVNGELNGLEECVKGLLRSLKSGGRGCVLTFHSLEDRIVKRVFRELSLECTCPKTFPICVCGKKKEIEEIGKKPAVASEQETKENSRSKCAKLRIARKI